MVPAGTGEGQTGSGREGRRGMVRDRVQRGAGGEGKGDEGALKGPKGINAVRRSAR